MAARQCKYWLDGYIILTDDEILAEAKERFKQCSDWENDTRENFRYDKRFDSGDSTNMRQWPDTMLGSQGNPTGKPRLTTNKLHQHVLQVTNDARQNKPAISIKPVSNGATFKASEVLEGIVRHIEYISNATEAYDNATNDQVVGGIGWWRVVTDYANDESFDQEIFIRRIPDALSVYLDPDIKQFDGSDARFGFVYDEMAQDVFNATYPEHKDEFTSSSALGADDFSAYNWYAHRDAKHVRVVEYYRRVAKKDRLHYLRDGSTVRESDAKAVGLRDLLKGKNGEQGLSERSREIVRHDVEWFLMAGNQIIDRKDWPGKYVPLVRIIGEEFVIDGKLDRKGLVRAMIDSQRMYNVMNSAAVEHVGGQTKTQWMASKESTEGCQEFWDDSNIKTFSVLFFNALREDGAVIPAPERIEPPTYAPGYQQALVQAANDMMGVSGQYEASFGQESNERSGKAINERVRNGNNSTYHFINNLAVGVRFTGKIILDLIPKIYDTKRVLLILGEDGTKSTVTLDPELKTAPQDNDDPTPQQVQLAINPAIGTYDVQADVGPSYGTKRMETFNAVSQILQQNESLTPIIGKFLFKAADFPLADEIGQALDQAFSKQANPQVEQAQQQLAAQHQVMQQQGQEIEKLKMNDLTKQLQKDIDWYKAETDRLKAVGGIDPAALMPVVRQLVSELLGTPVNPIIAAHTMENSQMIAAANPDPTQTPTQGAQ